MADQIVTETTGAKQAALDHVRQFVGGMDCLPDERTVCVMYTDGDEEPSCADDPSTLTLGDLRALAKAGGSSVGELGDVSALRKALWFSLSSAAETAPAADLPQMAADHAVSTGGTIRRLLEVVKSYEAWEADLILNADWSNELPRMTQAQFDRLMEIQAMRNAALAKAEGAANG